MYTVVRLGHGKMEKMVDSMEGGRILVLDLEVAVRLCTEVALVEVVHADETVLATGCVAVALRRDRDP